jgi:hypothetical protein
MRLSSPSPIGAGLSLGERVKHPHLQSMQCFGARAVAFDILLHGPSRSEGKEQSDRHEIFISDLDPFAQPQISFEKNIGVWCGPRLLRLGPSNDHRTQRTAGVQQSVRSWARVLCASASPAPRRHGCCTLSRFPNCCDSLLPWRTVALGLVRPTDGKFSPQSTFPLMVSGIAIKDASSLSMKSLTGRRLFQLCWL